MSVKPGEVHLALYTTQLDDTFIIDCMTNADTRKIKSNISTLNEEELELSIDHNRVDLTAGIENKQLMVKIRKLDKAIGENLKLLYGYQCQLCGFNFAEKHSTNIVETHHIEFFVTSLNNNVDNIIIMCPNHHRIIHKTNPLFEKGKLIFIYANGLKERIKLNKHL